VCVVPRSCAHAEDMWIVNVRGLGLWNNSPLKEAYVSAREYLASCWLPKCSKDVRFMESHPAGSHRRGSSGGSRGTRSNNRGLHDTADNDGDVELKSSEIEHSHENSKHIGDGNMALLGVIAEEHSTGIKM